MFCLLQLDLIRSRKKSLSWATVVAASMFYAMFGFVEASANFDHTQAIYESRTEIRAKLPVTKMALAFFSLHVTVATVWIILAAVRCLAHSRQRLCVIISVVVTETFATCCGQLLWAQSQTFS
jgi:hypothetical protein